MRGRLVEARGRLVKVRGQLVKVCGRLVEGPISAASRLPLGCLSAVSRLYLPPGGVRDATLEIKGESVYSKLKFEAGVHRVVLEGLSLAEQMAMSATLKQSSNAWAVVREMEGGAYE